MHYNTSLNSLSKWKNPIYSIKDPLKQRWAEIVQTMSTHVDGVCPLHIYINRRPLESQNPYAIEYRVNNFQPLTKDPFDRAINGIIDVCLSADIQVKAPDYIINNEFEINDKDVFTFCQSDLVRIREKDPNAVIVVLPKIKSIDEQNVSIVGIDIVIVPSADIDKANNYEIRFAAGEVGENKDKYYWYIENGQYTLEYPDDKGKLISYPIVEMPARKPYIDISENIVYEGKYKLRLPYLFGAAAWGDKFFGQESDFSIQATRYTYLKEIRAKEKCDEVGCVFLNGVHCFDDINHPCGKCGGSGYVKDDSPLGTIYVDYSKLNSEERAFPQVVQWAEPPQAALESSKTITEDYFNKTIEALGLVKQNLTNQSGVSKQFDYKEKLSTIYKIFNDNIRVNQEIYQFIEYFLVNEFEQTTQVYLVGEIGNSNVSELLEKLNGAKTNQSPASIITALIDQIYQKTLPPDISDLTIKTAKYYDKLYIYGSNEITQARAQFGTALTEKDIIVHNTLIDVITDYLKENGIQEMDKIVAYLDGYYARYATPVQTATTLGLL